MCVTFHQICIHLMQWSPKHQLQTGYIKTRTRGPYKPDYVKNSPWCSFRTCTAFSGLCKNEIKRLRTKTLKEVLSGPLAP